MENQPQFTTADSTDNNASSDQPSPELQSNIQHPTPATQQSQPQPAPVPTTPTNPQPSASNNPGLIVLQWLTYALWGWTVLGMSILTATVITHFVKGSTDWGFTPYGIAAILVLLPLAVACDFFYSKHEPVRKTGAATIVMVIHAVIFALFGVGSLIAAAISIVTLFISSSDTSGSQIALYSALIIVVLYLATLLRTLNPAKFPFIRRFYIIFMVVSVGIIALLGLMGPVAHAHLTRNDRLIENNLSTISSAIDSYTQSNKNLPNSLSSLNLTGDAQTLATNNSVEYTSNTKAPSPTTNNAYNYNSRGTNSSGKTYYYQLCVTYKAANNNNGYSYNPNSNVDSSGYENDTSFYISTHPAGRVCYKLDTQLYSL